jgi:hypothetical protein
MGVPPWADKCDTTMLNKGSTARLQNKYPTKPGAKGQTAEVKLLPKQKTKF